MAFQWNPIPNLPTPIVPIPVPPGEVTYEVKLVANTVDYGGAVRYNTANASYDVVYEFPTLNVTNGVFENGFFESANIGNAHINVATINHASINTANITNATIMFGYVTGNPNANMGIASKFYVDNAIAAISGGTGPDSTANLFITKGDLLVGISTNTANRLAVGTDGQLLTVFGSAAKKMQWTTPVVASTASQLSIGTHYHPTLKFSQILLDHADGIIMDDGESVANWDNLTADLDVSGSGGLDSSSTKLPDTWYEVWAIRNSTTGQRALLLHQMLKRTLDQSYFGAAGQGSQLLGYGNPNLTDPLERFITKVSQSFKPSLTGILRAVTLVGTVTAGTNPATDGNIWCTIEGVDGTGNADGDIWGTSRTIHSNNFNQQSQSASMHFVFDTNINVTPGTEMCVVIHEDWVINATSVAGGGLQLSGNSGPLGPGQSRWMANVGYNAGGTYSPYINIGFGDCRAYNVETGRWSLSGNNSGFGGFSDLTFKTYIENTTGNRVLPAGYDSTSLVSYARTNASSKFKEYHQKNRIATMGFDNDWLMLQTFAPFNQWISVHAYDVGSTVPPVPCTVYTFATARLGNYRTICRLGPITAITMSQSASPMNDSLAGAPPGFLDDNGIGLPGMVTAVPLDDSQQMLMWTSNFFNPGPGASIYLMSMSF